MADVRDTTEEKIKQKANATELSAWKPAVDEVDFDVNEWMNESFDGESSEQICEVVLDQEIHEAQRSDVELETVEVL
jgi:hypothetical protein